MPACPKRHPSQNRCRWISSPVPLRNLLLPATLLLSLSLVLPAVAAAQSGPLRGLDAYVEQALEEWGVPGMSLAVVQGNEVIYARGYGVRNVTTGEPVDEHTLFAIGSASKAFTAAALGMLVDEGKLEWDARASELIPGFAVAEPYVSKELTLIDLLTHRSGVSRDDALWYGSDLSRDDVVAKARLLTREASIRTRFLYNNIMYITAGQIIPELTGMSWDEFVEERIFDPLGMEHSNTSIKAFGGDANVAHPHAVFDGELVPVAWRDIDNAGPAGSINSSALEAANWIRLHLGSGAFEGQELLTPETVEKLIAPQFINEDPFWQVLGQTMGSHFLTYALGWAVEDFEGDRFVWHGGHIDGMAAILGFLPDRQVGVVTLTNMNQGILGLPITLRILDTLVGDDEVEDWAARYLESRRMVEEAEAARAAEVEASRVENAPPRFALEAYAGTYTDPLYGELEVTIQNGQLRLRYNPAYAGALEHWHYDTFRVVYDDRIMGRSFVTFELNARGEPSVADVQGLTRFRRN